MNYRIIAALLALSIYLPGCGSGALSTPVVVPVALKDVAADRMSYRYEGDVPGPDTKHLMGTSRFERSDVVQADFDTNRPTEVLERTLASPKNDRILAVYRQGEDVLSDFRLDMYTKEGKLLKKITHAEMAVQFPDTILWSPDGNNVAFVAKVRGAGSDELSPDGEKKPETDAKPSVVDRDTEEGPVAEKEEEEKPAETKGVEAPTDVLTFRTEQIYTCNTDGGEVKPITKVEGLMYFYFVWAPDSSALAALAAIHTEWKYFETRSKEAGQIFVPRGRPRLVEKSGRERKLDDAATAVQPVWSPDSAKVAVAFDKQVRIYDGVRNQPTQAAIPLKNELLISSRKYEEKLKAEGETLEPSNSNANSNSVANTVSNATQQPESALPDENLLVSFNPIVKLVWVEDKHLYFETGFVRNFLDDTESVRSYMRWHRLILSAQAVNLKTPQPAG